MIDEFSKEIIERMQELKWWEFSENIIRENFEIFNSELNMDIIDKLFKIKEMIKDV